MYFVTEGNIIQSYFDIYLKRNEKNLRIRITSDFQN